MFSSTMNKHFNQMWCSLKNTLSANTEIELVGHYVGYLFYVI